MKKIYKSENSLIFKYQFFDLQADGGPGPVETQNYIIVQVADSYYKNSFRIPDHSQLPDLEITYPLSGSLFCATNGVADHVDKNCCYLSFSGENHALQSRRSCRFQTLAVNVKEGPCLPMLRQLQRKYETDRCFRLPELSEALTDIVSALMAAEIPFLENHLESLITAVFIRLLRQGTSRTEPEFMLSEDKLPAVINYLDDHFLDICSLTSLASHFGYTYSHICKIFKKRYNITPGEYLLDKKMACASRLLEEGHTLKVIAERLGYSTQYNFSRAYKKWYGHSPRCNPEK